MTIINKILKWMALGIIVSVVGLGIACGGGGGDGGGGGTDSSNINPTRSEDGGGDGTAFMSDGIMTGLFEYIDDIQATIDADPNQGTSGTPCTVTITFSQGEDLVEDIETYQCVEEGTFHATPELDPAQESTYMWKINGLLSGNPGVVRYYALAADGSPIAQGEIELNGGGVVPDHENDCVYDDVWHFSETTDWGVLPTDWVDDSSDGSSPTYRVTTYEEKSCLQIKTKGDTWDRVRVRTTSSYRYGAGAGRYQWRVYVPLINEDSASSAIGVFLYSSDNNAKEIGFEIGYGTSDDRTAYEIDTGKLICYTTVDGDHSGNWPTNPIALDPGSWYTLQIVLTPNDKDKYVVSWKLKKEGDSEFWEAPEDYTCDYGPSDTLFYIECGVENSWDLWIGDNKPTEDKEAYFDYVFFTAQ